MLGLGMVYMVNIVEVLLIKYPLPMYPYMIVRSYMHE